MRTCVAIYAAEKWLAGMTYLQTGRVTLALVEKPKRPFGLAYVDARS